MNKKVFLTLALLTFSITGCVSSEGFTSLVAMSNSNGMDSMYRLLNESGLNINEIDNYIYDSDTGNLEFTIKDNITYKKTSLNNKYMIDITAPIPLTEEENKLIFKLVETLITDNDKEFVEYELAINKALESEKSQEINIDYNNDQTDFKGVILVRNNQLKISSELIINLYAQ